MKCLSMKEKEAVSCCATMRQMKKNQVIYFAEDPSDTLYFLKEGKVKISKTDGGGKELILRILGPGEVFGELALAMDDSREERAELMEDGVLCGIKTDELKPIIANNPKMNINIVKLIGFRLQKIENRLESLYFKNVNERVRGFIKDLCDNHGKKIGLGYEIEVKLNLTHADIAKLNATSRQAVTTVLNELERENIISYNRRRVLVKNYDALKST